MEESRIRRALGNQNILRIEHIGSTAVPHLKAKPTIDILLEVPDAFDKDRMVNKLKKLHYHFIPKPENPPPHMMFAKGYTLKGFKGPKLGLQGIRDYMDIPKRPLLNNMIKPKTGYTATVGKDLFYGAAVGGTDCIKRR
jgi:GrpB-like predicted nucleotidyltransferase (UPF0157 family)